MNYVLTMTGAAVAIAGFMHPTDPAKLFAHLVIILGSAVAAAGFVRASRRPQ